MGSCLLHAHPQSMDPSVGLHMPPHTPHVAYPWQVNPKLPYVPYIPHCAKSLQLCLTLCDPMNCSLPDSSVHGTLQARILEWVSMPSSRGYSQPEDQSHTFYASCIAR